VKKAHISSSFFRLAFLVIAEACPRLCKPSSHFLALLRQLRINVDHLPPGDD
jgi:hypothetical protein